MDDVSSRKEISVDGKYVLHIIWRQARSFKSTSASK